MRDGRWKLIVRYEGPSFELFDLASDPFEQNDLSAVRPELVQRLAADLAAHLAGAGARLPKPDPAYRPLPRKGQ